MNQLGDQEAQMNHFDKRGYRQALYQYNLILVGQTLILLGLNINTGRTNINSVRPRVNTVNSNVNTVRSRQPVPTKTSNNFSPKRPQGSAIKTSAGYNWRNTRPNSNCNGGPTFIRTVITKGPQGRPKPVKAWDEFEKVLWEYLKNMFEEPFGTYSIWSLPGQQRLICWRYYDACRVHCLNLESVDVYMLIERKYPLSAEVCKAMLDKKFQGGKPDEDCYKLLKMMEKQAGIRK
ncbi:hypothetical protein Tco_0080981 [Tanacetum coccineum]